MSFLESRAGLPQGLWMEIPKHNVYPCYVGYGGTTLAP